MLSLLQEGGQRGLDLLWIWLPPAQAADLHTIVLVRILTQIRPKRLKQVDCVGTWHSALKLCAFLL